MAAKGSVPSVPEGVSCSGAGWRCRSGRMRMITLCQHLQGCKQTHAYKKWEIRGYVDPVREERACCEVKDLVGWSNELESEMARTI